ncbi:MAG TPA: hypothetical protein VMV72_16445 [Verrucomicrobiae bacterium]|nr:hypothetical protein [Verrucomicrobiae bacterium]
MSAFPVSPEKEAQLVIDSIMVQEVAPWFGRFDRFPVLRQVWHGVLWVVVGLSYCGFFLSVVMGESMAFQLLNWLKVAPPRKLYWVVAIFTAAQVYALCGILTFVICQWLRARRVSIDLVVFFLGSLLSAWFISCLLPTGWK